MRVGGFGYVTSARKRDSLSTGGVLEETGVGVNCVPDVCVSCRRTRRGRAWRVDSITGLALETNRAGNDMGEA